MPVRERAEKQKGSEVAVNLPIHDLHNATVWLKLAFDVEKVVVLGGRGVNLHGNGVDRPTHDSDFAVIRRPTAEQFAQLPTTPGTDGAYFVLDREPNSLSRVKLSYHSEEVNRATMSKGVAKGMQVDLYYPGYISPVNNNVPRFDINNIPITALIERSETVTMGGLSFDVVGTIDLSVMKYVTWLERGNGDLKAKDMRDLKTLFNNYYNNPKRFDEYVVSITKVLDEFMPERKAGILTGILTHIAPEADSGMKNTINAAIQEARRQA